MHQDPPVLLYKSSLMQRLSDWVRVGYRYWTSGTVEADKAAAFVRKFDRYYLVHLDRNRRARAKKAGEGCAVLLLWQSSPGVLAWFLLVSPGDHPAHQLEKLKDAMDSSSRIILTGYELVRATRPGASAPSWTWRMTAAAYSDWRTRVIDVVRRGDDYSVSQAIGSLYRVPGFAGCRAQVKKCLELFRSEWKRSKSVGAFPEVPRLLPYLRRVESSSIGLSTWLAAAKRSRA